MYDELFDWAFGDNEDDLNEALLQTSDEFESKITPRALGLAPFRGLHLQQAPPAATKPTSSY